MIALLFMNGITKLMYFLLGLFPNFDAHEVSIYNTFTLLAPVLSIFPLDLFKFIISNGFMWVGLRLAWSVIEWVYKKIPGVD